MESLADIQAELADKWKVWLISKQSWLINGKFG